MDGSAIGAIAGVAFGCAWGVAGATGLPRPLRAWAGGLSAAVSAILIAALALIRTAHPSGIFRGSVYGMTVGGETAVIFLAIWLLRRYELSQFLIPTIGFIVGVHFLGLWKATGLSLFRWTSGAMCLVCVLAAILPGAAGVGGVDTRRAVAGLGCAVVLWSAALAVLW